DRLMREQKAIVARRQRQRVGTTVTVMVDGPSPEHELAWTARLAGQAPDIDSMGYLTDADPASLRPGALITAQIVGSRGYDLVARVWPTPMGPMRPMSPMSDDPRPAVRLSGREM